MNTKANKELVSDFFSNFGRNDVPRAVSMMTDDFTWWIVGKPELFPICGEKSKAEMTQLLHGLMSATTEGLKVEPVTLTAEDDRVAVEAVSYGKVKNGKVYNNGYHFLVRVRDGKIASVREYLDTMHTNDVLGELIAAAKGA